jgi:hypothetical protein
MGEVLLARCRRAAIVRKMGGGDDGCYVPCLLGLHGCDLDLSWVGAKFEAVYPQPDDGRGFLFHCNPSAYSKLLVSPRSLPSVSRVSQRCSRAV